MSASPTSPSRRRQQSSGSSQPQPIAPAPLPATTAQPIAPAPGPSASAPPPPLPPPIKTDAANAVAAAAAAAESNKSPTSPISSRKRKAAEMSAPVPAGPSTAPSELSNDPSASLASQLDQAPPTAAAAAAAPAGVAGGPQASSPTQPPPKKSRTNTPWTPAEERRLKTLRDAGSSWGEIAKEFPNRTEGSVKKHWYKDMHYADFAEDESAALLAAIREYEANKWKEIGKKVGKPAKACEQYAKEHFQGKL